MTSIPVHSRRARQDRLTDTPLDLDNPAHLAALLRAYERFPEIGGRVTPG
ncbi:DUF5953 family protein [Hyalangium gracile]|nr:DUF5953 family protein [Hyalangium gracile]